MGNGLREGKVTEARILRRDYAQAANALHIGLNQQLKFDAGPREIDPDRARTLNDRRKFSGKADATAQAAGAGA